MRAILVSLVFASALHAGEPMCGTGPANDLRVRETHERTRARIAANEMVDTRAATLREGAFYVESDETITAGYRRFDLHDQSLVFTPAGDAAFTMRREPLQYVEPVGEPLRDFRTAEAFFVAHDLPFAMPLFGASVTRIYVDAFNGIRTANPRVQRGTQFDAIEAGVHRGPLLSPLMLTVNRPRFVVSPRVWIDQTADAVTVTWRSSGTGPFAYDVQAKLASDGTVTYSYRSIVGMRWGAPILSPGLDPATVSRATLQTANDDADDVDNSFAATVRPMLDVRRVDVQRLADSDLFAVRITLAGAIDRTKLAEGEVLEYQARLSALEIASVKIDRVSTRVRSFSGMRYDLDGESAHIDGNVIEIYGVQSAVSEATVRVATYVEANVGSNVGSNGRADLVSMLVPFTPAPRSIVTDLSSVAQNARLDVPIAEPFVLGAFDPYRVWDILQTAYGLSSHEYDAVAFYQSFYTDIILYAGGYATGSNPQVDGIAPFAPFYGSHAARAPTLMHLNQLTYNYSAAEATASKLLLHELGHRWLYFFSIAENGTAARSLNPVSPHPAAYVHTAAAFPVYGENESSVMGGAYFTPQPDGSHVAHAANMGYSWTDLYLMGLAAPEEVPPWFYLAGTSLPLEYWPAEGAIANGEKREVQIGQITAVHGARRPSTALSQRQFRVMIVLVTENGEAATDAEVAQVNEWRRVLERNFALATGGRGRLITTFVRPAKRRAS